MHVWHQAMTHLAVPATQIDEFAELYADLLMAILECPRPPEELAVAVGLEGPEAVARIESILANPKFHDDLTRARADVVMHTQERIRRDVPKNYRRMDAIAGQTHDWRVKFQGVKDLLDRAGMAPAQMILVGPAAYRKMIEPLLEEEEPEEKVLPEGNGDGATAG